MVGGARALALLSLLPLLVTGAAGCATAAARPDDAGAPRVVLQAGVLPARVLAEAVPEATARLAARGFALRQSTRVVVHPDPMSFFRATGQHDPGLRAWTTFETVHLMPLDVWAQADHAAVVERLAHELCHAALYQSFGSEARARAAAIPRFFEEGTCSVIAEQGPRRMSKEDVVALAPPMPFDIAVFRGDPDVAYAASHHALALLDETRGRFFLVGIVADAAREGGPGCVERALARAVGTDVPGLWRLLVDSVEQAT